MGIGESFLESGRESGALEQVVRAAGPPAGDGKQLWMLADDHQIVEAEVLHHTRHRADIARFPRLDEDDAESAHRDKLSALSF